MFTYGCSRRFRIVWSSIGLLPQISLQPTVYFTFQAVLAAFLLFLPCLPGVFRLGLGFVLFSIGLEPLILLVLFFSYRVYLWVGLSRRFSDCAVFYRSSTASIPSTYGVFWIPGAFAASLLSLPCLPGVLRFFVGSVLSSIGLEPLISLQTYGVFWFLGIFCFCFSSLPGAFTWCFFVFFLDLCCPLSVLNR